MGLLAGGGERAGPGRAESPPATRPRSPADAPIAPVFSLHYGTLATSHSINLTRGPPPAHAPRRRGVGAPGALSPSHLPGPAMPRRASLLLPRIVGDAGCGAPGAEAGCPRARVARAPGHAVWRPAPPLAVKFKRGLRWRAGAEGGAVCEPASQPIPCTLDRRIREYTRLADGRCQHSARRSRGRRGRGGWGRGGRRGGAAQLPAAATSPAVPSPFAYFPARRSPHLSRGRILEIPEDARCTRREPASSVLFGRVYFKPRPAPRRCRRNAVSHCRVVPRRPRTFGATRGRRGRGLAVRVHCQRSASRVGRCQGAPMKDAQQT